MGCFPSKAQASTSFSCPADRTTVSVTTQAIPGAVATKKSKKAGKKPQLSHVERENPGPDAPIPQWPSLAERSLDSSLPVANDYVPPRGVRGGQSPPVGWSVFKNSRDRWKFIRSALLVLSGNGFHSITSNRIELFFPRVSFNQAIAYRASLAVMDECGLQIKHSIVSANWGADRRAAFIHLMFDVEQQLEVLLSSSLNHIPVLRNDEMIRPSRPMLMPQSSASSTSSSSRQITARRSQPSLSTTQPTYRGRVIGEIGYSPHYSPPVSGPRSASNNYQNRMSRPALSTINTASRASLVSIGSGNQSLMPSPTGPQARQTPVYVNDYRYDWRRTSSLYPPQVHRRDRPIIMPSRSKSSSDLLQTPIRYKSLDPRADVAPKIDLEYFAKDLLNERAGEMFEPGKSVLTAKMGPA